MKKVYEKYKWDEGSVYSENTRCGYLITKEVRDTHNTGLKKAIKETEEQTAKEIINDLKIMLVNSEHANKEFDMDENIRVLKNIIIFLEKKYLGDKSVDDNKFNK